MFEERVQGLMRHANRDGVFAGTVQSILEDQIRLFAQVDQALGERDYPTDYQQERFSRLGDGLLDDLREALASGTDEAILHWVREASEVLSAHTGRLVDAQELPESDGREISLRSALIAQQASSLLDQVTLRASALRLNEELQDSVDKAKDAAGEVGNASLSSHFATYADDEVRAANGFRRAALVGFALALAFALLFGNGKEGWLLTFQNDWTALAFKVTGALGIGGISAYLARQAGQHRRMSNWARSMAVQLQSFPAFIEPLAYEQQADMYQMLARRVFTAPPEKNGDASEDSIGAAQLLDLVTNLVKRSSSQAPSVTS